MISLDLEYSRMPIHMSCFTEGYSLDLNKTLSLFTEETQKGFCLWSISKD